jgi:CheY-like chemotaxis protein
MDIMVVDDEEMVNRIFSQRLRKEIASGALRLHFATRGEQALEELEALGFQVGLVLCDINMPGMGGMELLKRIRLHDLSVKVYMVSAYEGEEYRNQCLKLGADGFFPKPMEFSLLKELLDTL